MVSVEELLARVGSAQTEAERQWVLLELQMSQMSPALVSMLWAAAIPHWFDAKILAALRPELADQADELFEQLQGLTFVEAFPGRGFNIHELTRDVLLERLWSNNRSEFLDLSQRVADYLFDVAGGVDLALIEVGYHDVLTEGKAQTGRLLDIAMEWAGYRKVDALQTLIKHFEEHQQSHRLEQFGQAFSLYLESHLASLNADFDAREALLDQVRRAYANLGWENRYVAALLHDLASSYEERANYSEAEPLLRRTLEIREEQLGANHPDTANSLNNLALLYESQRRYSDAEPLLRRSLKISEEQLGVTHPDTAASLNNLALLYESQGRYSKAEPLLRRSLEICEGQLGVNHPNTATSLNNLAGLYGSQGRYSEAEPLYLRALEIDEEQLGANHPDTAISLNNLALLYKYQRRYSEAEPLLRRSLEICEEQLGATHPKTAISQRNLAKLYQDQERYSEAVPLWER
ncbi:MAG: tetratricopeptide repeat protein [Cyanobacteria bacterium P01_F01_bin.153]